MEPLRHFFDCTYAPGVTMPAKRPDEGYRRTMSVILIIVALIAVVTIGVLVYWSTRGKPVQGPSAPQGESTIPGI